MLPDPAAEYLSIGRELIASFDKLASNGEQWIKTDSKDAYVKAGLALALAVHVHRLGTVALDLLERDTPVLLVVPTMRGCFETALTAHWIAQSSDAAYAMYNKEIKQRLALQKTLADAQSATMQEIADHIAHADLPSLSTSSDTQARNFEQLLKDLAPGGPDAYAYYRMLCGYTHPSGSLADQYLEEHPTAPFQLRLEPKETFPLAVCTNLVGCCLVWAGSAARYVMRDKTARRSQLRSAAQALGTVADIKLNDEAFLRQRLPKW
jgi:hypothetical protein